MHLARSEFSLSLHVDSIDFAGVSVAFSVGIPGKKNANAMATDIRSGFRMRRAVHLEHPLNNLPWSKFVVGIVQNKSEFHGLYLRLALRLNPIVQDISSRPNIVTMGSVQFAEQLLRHHDPGPRWTLRPSKTARDKGTQSLDIQPAKAMRFYRSPGSTQFCGVASMRRQNHSRFATKKPKPAPPRKPLRLVDEDNGSRWQSDSFPFGNIAHRASRKAALQRVKMRGFPTSLGPHQLQSMLCVLQSRSSGHDIKLLNAQGSTLIGRNLPKRVSAQAQCCKRKHAEGYHANENTETAGRNGAIQAVNSPV